MASPDTASLFLKSSAEIERVKTTGQRLHTPLFHLAFSSTAGLGPTRIGIIVGKRFGRAVQRNRAKRRFRELARQAQPIMNGQRDILVFPRRAALTVRYGKLRELWIRTLQEHGFAKASSSCVPCA